MFRGVIDEWYLFVNLMFRTNFGGDLWGWESTSIQYPSYDNQEPSTTNGFSANSDHGYNWTWINTIQFSETFDRHDIELLLGTEAHRDAGNARRANVQGVFSLHPDYMSLSTGSGTLVISGCEWENSILSCLTRLDYSF